MTTSRQLVEDCRHLPKPADAPIVRVYVANGAVTRAITLDPELPADLRSCLESSAMKIKNVAAGVPEKTEVKVTYGPKPQPAAP